MRAGLPLEAAALSPRRPPCAGIPAQQAQRHGRAGGAARAQAQSAVVAAPAARLGGRRWLSHGGSCGADAAPAGACQ